MSTFEAILLAYSTPIGVALGLAMGFMLGWYARGKWKENQNGKEKVTQSGALATIALVLMICLWAGAHVNNIFFGGGDVNIILNIIGGLAVSSLIQEKDAFIKIISAVRGGNNK